MADDGLPTRAQDLADAWRCSRRALLDGSMGSLESARERRLILREAEAEGVLDEMRKIIGAKINPWNHLALALDLYRTITEEE